MEPIQYPDESEQMLFDLYELYFPPRDEEMYHDMMAGMEWPDYY